MKKFKVGTTVRITKKAIKNFYGTEKCIDGYFSHSDTNFDFLEFFKHHRFNLGLDCGIVTGEGGDNSSKVYFMDSLGSLDFCYVENKDLEEVK